MGRILIILGLALLVTGALLTWAPGALGWFGRLPGDIRIERPSGTVFIPITSSILVSLVLTAIVNLILRR